MLRALDKFPRQGVTAPWRVHHNNIRDNALNRRGDLEEGMEFATAADAAAPAEPVAA